MLDMSQNNLQSFLYSFRSLNKLKLFPLTIKLLIFIIKIYTKMMFMNLNAKSNDTQASSKLLLNASDSPLLKNSDSKQQINEFMQFWSARLVSNDNTISYERQNYATDQKNTIQIKIRQFKKKFKNTFTNNIYKPLTFYEFHMVDHLHQIFKSVPLSKIAESIAHDPYIPNYLDILAFTRQIVASQDVSKDLKSYAVSSLQTLIKTVSKTSFSLNKNIDSLYTQMQTNILLMILTFKSLQTSYTPYIRRVIKRIFNQLSADSFMNTMETLRYLENERPEIQTMPQLEQKELTEMNNRILMKTFDKYNRNGTIPKIIIKKVSQNQRRKVVNILVSGFLSQDQDKKSQWQSLLNCMPDSEVYGLDWQSESLPKLVGFMATSVKDLLFTKATLQDKFNDNPFNPAFAVAQESGRYLAHVMHQLFPTQFINIIGYSLGTELIKDFVKTTLELNGGKNLQKIVLLGGVSDINQFQIVLKNCTFPLSITNMYTQNDSVLATLLKRCRKGIEPIGLKQLAKSVMHCIDNTDVTKQISGHLAYMTNFGKVADLLELCEE